MRKGKRFRIVCWFSVITRWEPKHLWKFQARNDHLKEQRTFFEQQRGHSNFEVRTHKINSEHSRKWMHRDWRISQCSQEAIDQPRRREGIEGSLQGTVISQLTIDFHKFSSVLRSQWWWSNLSRRTQSGLLYFSAHNWLKITLYSKEIDLEPSRTKAHTGNCKAVNHKLWNMTTKTEILNLESTKKANRQQTNDYKRVTNQRVKLLITMRYERIINYYSYWISIIDW